MIAKAVPERLLFPRQKERKCWGSKPTFLGVILWSLPFFIRLQAKMKMMMLPRKGFGNNASASTVAWPGPSTWRDAARFFGAAIDLRGTERSRELFPIGSTSPFTQRFVSWPPWGSSWPSASSSSTSSFASKSKTLFIISLLYLVYGLKAYFHSCCSSPL